MIKIYSAIILFFITFLSFSEEFSLSNTYYYGPNLSQNEACQKSLNIAKKKALERKYEKIDTQTLLLCDDKDRYLCQKLENILSKTNGVIKNLKITKKEVGYDEKFKSNFCKIKITGFILTPTGKFNPNLDFSLKLKKEKLKTKENLKVLISPSVPMYFNIFHLTLLNSETTNNGVIKKIFPNQFDEKNLLEFTTTIPRSEDGYDFNLVFDAQKGYKYNKEFILVLGTLDKVSFLKEYKLIDLREKINAIDLGKRIEKIQTIEVLKTTN